MNKKEFLLKLIRAMKGFATAKEILDEYNSIENRTWGYSPRKEIIENITDWLRWNFTENDPQFIIWERLEKEGLI